jgi:hypothetical protein
VGMESIGGFIDYKSIGEELKDNLPTLPTVFESLSDMLKRSEFPYPFYSGDNEV